MNIIIKTAGVNAGLTALYVFAISSFLFYIPKIFDTTKPDTVFAPIIMLSLLVFSASLVGALIFGRPILWYLDGKKKEAVSLLFYTLGFFFIITIAVACAVYIAG
jgi:cytochrome c oxidase assembly factor CtaG